MTDTTSSEMGWEPTSYDTAMFASSSGRHKLYAKVLNTNGPHLQGRDQAMRFSLHERGDDGKSRLFHFDERTGDRVRESVQEEGRSWGQKTPGLSPEEAEDHYPLTPTEGMRDFLKEHPQIVDALRDLDDFAPISEHMIAVANDRFQQVLQTGRAISD